MQNPLNDSKDFFDSINHFKAAYAVLSFLHVSDWFSRIFLKAVFLNAVVSVLILFQKSSVDQNFSHNRSKLRPEIPHSALVF